MSDTPNRSDDAVPGVDPETAPPSWEDVAVRLFLVSLPIALAMLLVVLATPRILWALDLPITLLRPVVEATGLIGMVAQLTVTARVLWTMRGEQGLRWMAGILGFFFVLEVLERLIVG